MQTIIIIVSCDLQCHHENWIGKNELFAVWSNMGLVSSGHNIPSVGNTQPIFMAMPIERHHIQYLLLILKHWTHGQQHLSHSWVKHILYTSIYSWGTSKLSQAWL